MPNCPKGKIVRIAASSSSGESPPTPDDETVAREYGTTAIFVLKPCKASSKNGMKKKENQNCKNSKKRKIGHLLLPHDDRERLFRGPRDQDAVQEDCHCCQMMKQ